MSDMALNSSGGNAHTVARAADSGYLKVWRRRKYCCKLRKTESDIARCWKQRQTCMSTSMATMAKAKLHHVCIHCGVASINCGWANESIMCPSVLKLNTSPLESKINTTHEGNVYDE
jgi:hypothetical protein